MKVRIISGVIGATLLISIIALNQSFPILINLIFALSTLACVIEVLSANNSIKNYKISMPSMLLAVLFPMLISTNYWQILLAVYLLSVFIILLKYHTKIAFQDIAFAFTTTIIITGGFSSIIMWCDTNREFTSYFVLIALAIPWLADVGGYFVGSFFGKHKLCPLISPKKTVEGAVGGIILGVLSPIIITLIFNSFLFTVPVQINFLNIIIVSAVCTVVSIIGDLSFSLIKRTYNVKDYGSVIPGHGGILDRCDSLIFSTPILLVLVNYLPLITIVKG